MKQTLPVLASLAMLAGCVPPPFPVPPPLPAEILPLPPVAAEPLVWQPGDWIFAGGSYRYEPGHYVPAAGHSRNWAFGHWLPTDAGPLWVPGGWL